MKVELVKKTTLLEGTWLYIKVNDFTAKAFRGTELEAAIAAYDEYVEILKGRDMNAVQEVVVLKQDNI
jgi:hypothetical protein